MSGYNLGLGMAEPELTLCYVCSEPLDDEDVGTTCQVCDTSYQTSLLEYQPIFESYHKHGMRIR